MAAATATVPTVSDLRGLSDDELVARHDALADRSRSGDGGPVGPGFYLDELRARVEAQQLEQLERLVVAIYLVSAVVIIIAVLVLIIAL
ncbi:MAG: hypothetical protein QOH72_2496 [Solirubrobacteraceae bacterium]|jgi:hypothetical protein|nr:hypothetical protein [Solirubrobacteraceae bacterium]